MEVNHFWISLNTKIKIFSKKMKFFTSYTSKSNTLDLSLMDLLCPLYFVWLVYASLQAP